MNALSMTADKQKTASLNTITNRMRDHLAIMGEGVALCLEGVVGKITQEQQTLLLDFQENVDRLTQLVSCLPDLPKIEAHTASLQLSTVDIKKLLKKIEKNLGIQAAKKNIHLKITCQQHINKMFTDADKLRQIFTTLIREAITLSNPEGEIAVHISESTSSLQCSIMATGTYISPEELNNLFTLSRPVNYQDFESNNNEKLDLVIAREIVEKLDGKIRAESVKKHGTTFHFTLPKKAFPTILIIDHEKPVIDSLKELMYEEEYNFISATTGEKAVNLAMDEKPSLILLGNNIEDMTACEIICYLKKDKRTCGIPIILMQDDPVDPEELKKQNTWAAIPTVTKSLDLTDLKKRILDAWGAG